jgi:hypothetical protein
MSGGAGLLAVPPAAANTLHDLPFLGKKEVRYIVVSPTDGRFQTHPTFGFGIVDRFEFQ